MKTPHKWNYGSDDSREAVWSRVLKTNYDEVVQEPVPDRFRELLEQLEDAESRER